MEGKLVCLVSEGITWSWIFNGPGVCSSCPDPAKLRIVDREVENGIMVLSFGYVVMARFADPRSFLLCNRIWVSR